MKKDVVYIDADDDITAIINKLKASGEKIVALVPPKRIGVLQSAVNLQLLARAAKQGKKHTVIITNNQALSQLAASAKIPTAPNLQSKPEIAEIPVLSVDDEDIIDGEKLSVGEYAEQRDVKEDKEAALISGVDVRDEEAKAVGAAAVRGSKKSAKVPNFGNFRKKLLIGVAAGLLLVGGLVWALVFAPAATVTLTAKTTPVPVNDVVRLGSDTNVERGVVKSQKETVKKDVSIEFEATGEKDVGDKATGTVKLSNSKMSEVSVSSGTVLQTSSGSEYLTDNDVTVSAASCAGTIFNCHEGSSTVTVTAREPGKSYNGASGSLSGAPSGVSASFSDSTSGGTTKMVAVVTAADVQKAKEKLVKESTDDIKKELVAKFGDGARVIDDSFDTDYGDVTSSPSVGKEAKDDKAKLEAKVTYSMVGIPTIELENYLRETMKQQMEDQTVQKVYADDADKATIDEYSNNSVRIDATGQIGPKIDEADIKERVAGKRYGDIREDLKQIDGVSDVDVKYSYFWVRTVPKNLDKITIRFEVQENGG